MYLYNNKESKNRMSETSNDKHWFAMRVFRNKVVECKDLLERLDAIEIYAPTEVVKIHRPGKPMRTKEVPVVPSLLFFRSTIMQTSMVEETLGNLANLYTRKRENEVIPFAISDKEMAMFIMVSSSDQEGLEYFMDDELDKYKKGERVRVIDGRFKGLEGEIKRIKHNHRLVVTVKGICAVATSYIPRCFLEKRE